MVDKESDLIPAARPAPIEPIGESTIIATERSRCRDPRAPHHHRQAMDEQNQIEIPQSFMALYSRNGKPFETRRTIEARYDLCEDLAAQTADVCHTLQFKHDLSESEVLSRCRASFDDGQAVTAAEADWVVRRVAEMLQWAPPSLPGD